MKHLFRKALLINTYIIPFALIIISILLVYWDLPKTFFQQDEWLGFARMISYEAAGGIQNVLQLPFILGKGHFTPLSYYQLFLEFKLFGLSFENFAYVSIATHIINSVLLFYFISLLLKNKFLALCSSLIFAVGVISNQAVSWIAASPNTQGAILFLLLSLIFVLKYLQNNKKINYHAALIFFFIGLLFKETILFFFILAPIIWFLFGQKKEKKSFFQFVKPLVILGLIYFLLRASLFLIPAPIGVEKINTINLSITSDILRLISSPFKILPQAIIPQPYLINISDIATLLFYPQYVFNGSVNPYFSQTIVFGKVIPLLSIPIFLILFITYKLLLIKKEIAFSRTLVFSISLIMLSALPFAFIPGDLADLPIYEPRNLHGAVIGTSIFLVLVMYSAVKFFLKKNKYIYFSVFVLLTPILFTHFYLTSIEIGKVVHMSTARKYILNSIKMSYPKLPQKVVFYTESDTSYYGMPIEEKILPFQLNFGTVLLVWYQKTANFPPCLYDFNIEAFHMLAQQYRECNGRSFGYFRDYDKLINVIKEKHIPVDDVIAFSWNGEREELEDITEQTRVEIKRDIVYEAGK